MRKYQGPLGRFSYSEDQFCLSKDVDGNPFLEYIGTEMDGSKIVIPEGIRDATGMFQDKMITSQPKIPDSVQTADCMFAGCENLVAAGELPNGLTSADYMYACCPSLEKTGILPETLLSAQGMFDGCTALREVSPIPNGIKDIRYMFWDCPSADQVELPEGIRPEDVYGLTAEMEQDDLSDLSDTITIKDDMPYLVRMFGQAEAEAQAQHKKFQPSNVVPQERKMSRQERDNLLLTLNIEGLEQMPDYDMDLTVE